MSKQIFLAVDTSHSKAQIIIFDENQVLGEKNWEKSKSHSEVITLAFSELIQNLKILPNNITKVYCVEGPGSFTGLRVGINFTKSLAYSLNCPMGKINALDLLALNASSQNGMILSAIDAQKNSIFYSLYENKNGQLTILNRNGVVDVRKLDSVVDERVQLCGLGLEKYVEFLGENIKSRLIQNESFKSCDLKNLVSQNSLINLDQSIHWKDLQPLYIKASAPEEKLNPTTS